ncbi:MAG: MFS transporter [Phycisphaerae bacterium]|nr:MFS transporter [Phycisphaerae bacterium]
MLFRFCLYGFLKNQQYFEPFWILAFRAKGLSFAAIGLLIGFRELCVNLLEIPTGAVADVLGRRASMIFSFFAYIGAFVLFATFDRLGLLFAGMLLFAAGEAFRTGTHKAMIFAWLEHEGRTDEKTKTYGYTRSWSQLGSALGVLLAAGMVFGLEDYRWVFWFSIVPYIVNIINFMGYPAYLDGPRGKTANLPEIVKLLFASLRDCLRRRRLRRLLAESMGFEGVYKVSKDYLQPVLHAAALSLPVLLSLDGRRRTAVLVGAVYVVLYLLSSVASRHSHALANRAGSDERGARRLWGLYLAFFLVLAAGLLTGVSPLATAGFVVLAMLQNFWRPLLIGRVAGESGSRQMATILSVESQAKSLFAAVVAPLVGWAVDAIPANLGTPRFLPAAAVGVLIAGLALVVKPKSRE